jgi:hypothetical protein
MSEELVESMTLLGGVPPYGAMMVYCDRYAK